LKAGDAFSRYLFAAPYALLAAGLAFVGWASRRRQRQP
jgi:hypothetical protein